MESLNSPTPPFPVENSYQAVRPGRHTSLTALLAYAARSTYEPYCAPCLRGPQISAKKNDSGGVRRLESIWHSMSRRG